MIIAHFLVKHWLDMLLALLAFFAVNFRFIPPDMVGLDREYREDGTGKMRKQRRQSLLEGVTHLSFTLTRSLLVLITFRGTTSLFIFGVVVFQLIEQHTVTTTVVILAVVGLIALHFEKIIEQADTVSIWKIFTYKKR